MRFNTTVLFRGVSLLDNLSKIVVLYVAGSDNVKTGPMGQAYIMLENVHPTEGVRAGLDTGICGACPLAGGNGCYVITGFGPSAVWNAYKKGNVNKFDSNYFKTISDYQPTRIGAYGDPVAVPRHVWDIVIGKAGHTGYTSSWRLPHAKAYRDILSASVHTIKEYEEAKDMGWKTYFTPIDGTDPSSLGLTLCPASKEATMEREHAGKPKRITCADCLLCSGAGKPSNDIFSPMHGGKAVMSRINKLKSEYAMNE